MHPIQMVDLQRQYARSRPAFDEAMARVLEDTAFIGGPAVKAFSANLSGYLGGAHVVPCANGTDALQIALMALGVGQGDEVITVPFTFVSTVEVVALLGARPVFVDVRPDTFNLDTDLLEAAITPRTKAIIPVHLYGQACAMDQLMAIADRHGIPVVEDTAQALGGTYRGADGVERRLGTIGAIGTTSFYPTKNLGAWGDGGALFSRDETLAGAIRLITNHGSDRKYYYDAIGVNSRLDSLQAAILDVKLAQLDDYAARRRAAADRYDTAFASLEGVTVPYRAPYAQHVFHQYTLTITPGHRDPLRQYLTEREIPTMVYYPVPLHLSPAYGAYGYREGDFPVSEALSGTVLSLPMHTELDDEQLDHITQAVRGYFAL